jgi:hypothetical protein
VTAKLSIHVVQPPRFLALGSRVKTEDRGRTLIRDAAAERHSGGPGGFPGATSLLGFEAIDWLSVTGYRNSV